jgi:hypothetical protein
MILPTPEQLDAMDETIQKATADIVGDREFPLIMTVLQNVIAGVCLTVTGADRAKSAELIDLLATRAKLSAATREYEVGLNPHTPPDGKPN